MALDLQKGLVARRTQGAGRGSARALPAPPPASLRELSVALIETGKRRQQIALPASRDLVAGRCHPHGIQRGLPAVGSQLRESSQGTVLSALIRAVARVPQFARMIAMTTATYDASKCEL